ncbi:MAG: carboxypeptidase regulatory-like domain-containing protein, partial [Acidobacteriia bacterium]|nr:carboxypeptidase regulatory-like domain-containing protein [Terriglobia bacterium]
DSSGLYSAPNLLPGNYEVSVTAPGFSTQMRKGITLTVGAQQALDITMQVGQVSQTVEVTEEAPKVELSSSALSNEVSATTVRELPLNGRSWVDLGSLQPGVSQPNTQKPLTIAGRGQRGFGTQVSITGARPDENLYRLDGINVNDYANNSPSNVSGGTTGVDAIQEFSVLTGNAPAQYGRSSGGIFNAITRSGTNQFHGSAYEFLRNSAMDARNFFDPAKIPSFRRNQFGGSLGGPIRKNSTFFFGDYEGLRQSLGVTQTGTTLSNNARQGILSTGNVTVDPNVAAFIAAIYPIANGAVLGAGDTARFTNSVTQPTTDNFWTTRLDQKFSDKDSMDGVYSFDAGSLYVPDLQDSKLGLFSTRHHSAAIEETHVFNASATNSFRLGFNRSVGSIGSTPTAVNPAVASATFAAIPGHFAPSVTVPGLSIFNGGLDGPPIYSFHYNSYQAYDDAFLTKGIHQIKVGFSFERIQDNDGALQGLDGAFTFKTLAGFLQNQPSKFSGALPTTGTSERGIRESIFGAYFQDDIRIKSNLTVNVGLRYEFASVPTEVHNEITNMVPVTAAQPVMGSPWFSNFTKRNFQPRIGFSFDPFKDGKTAIRGGFGIYDMLPLPYELFLGNATTAPYFVQGSVNSVAGSLNGTFPGGAIPFLSGNPKTFKYSYLEPDSKRRYIMQWNLNVQRQLAPNLTLMVGYVASRGLHLPQHQDDMDFVIPTLTSAGYVFPFGAGVQKLNPNAGVIVGEEMQNHSWYDALQVEVTKTLSHGIMLHGSYSWGRNIDYSSGTFAGDSFGNGETTQPWFAPQIWRGLSDFNISQNLVINGTWNLPSPTGGTGVAGHVLGGWQLGGILKINGGVPFTPNFGAGGDPAGVLGSDTTFETPNRLTGSDCNTLINPRNPNNYIKAQCFAIPSAPSAVFYTANCDPSKGKGIASLQCFNLFGNSGRNILIGPGLVNMDFSVFKNNYIRKMSENFNLQFRWEVFNILNRANFSVPASTSIFDAAGNNVSASDLITSTQTPSRQMQVALKVIW